MSLVIFDKKESRKVYIDILRVISCFLVIYIHSDAFRTYNPIEGRELSRVIMVFIENISLAAVPMFITISGALLLGKKETVSEVLGKRVLRFLTILFLSSLLYYVYLIAKAEVSNPSIFGFLRLFWSNKIISSYWFMYFYIGLLILLPLIRPMAQNMSDKTYAYYFAVFVIFSYLIPSLQKLLRFDNLYISISEVLGGSIFYPLLGYFVVNRIPETFFSKKKVVFASSITILIIVAEVVIGYNCSILNGKIDTTYSGYFTNIIIALVIFVARGISVCRDNNHISFGQKFITILGQCSLGVYLLEPMTRGTTRKMVFENLSHHIGIIPSGILWCLCTFLGTSLLVYLIKKICSLIIKNFWRKKKREGDGGVGR